MLGLYVLCGKLYSKQAISTKGQVRKCVVLTWHPGSQELGVYCRVQRTPRFWKFECHLIPPKVAVLQLHSSRSEL